MAIFEQGVNRRTNQKNFNNNKNNSFVNNTLTPARVTDIILDENHPNYNEWGDIGVVFVEDMSNTSPPSPLPFYPLNPTHQFPLINEIVLCVRIPINVNYDTKSVTYKQYYLNPVKTWNSPHNNALPNFYIHSDLSISQQAKQNPSLENNYTPPVVHLNSQKNKSQNTFVEKSNIYPLMPFMGDNIIEGRYGQSIRLGHTAKSNSSKKNNWSESGENGDPIMILRNGQSPKVNEEGWVPTTENIKDDLSSIYLTSTQKLPFSLTNENFVSYTTPPELPSNYINPQIILNSDRVVINAKTDSVLISGNRSVGISSNRSINLEAKEVYMHSTDIRLGDKGATQPVLKGDITVFELKYLITELRNIAKVLSSIQTHSDKSSLVPDRDIQSVAKTTLNNMNILLGRIDNIKSNFVKTT